MLSLDEWMSEMANGEQVELLKKKFRKKSVEWK